MAEPGEGGIISLVFLNPYLKGEKEMKTKLLICACSLCALFATLACKKTAYREREDSNLTKEEKRAVEIVEKAIYIHDKSSNLIYIISETSPWNNLNKNDFVMSVLPDGWANSYIRQNCITLER